jgi:hypothetical protein
MTAVTGPILGSWYHRPEDGGGTDELVATFLADGTFLIADKGTHANDPSGDSGLEWGNYTWNSATGAFTFEVLVNTDGEWGISHSGTFKATVANDIVTLTTAEGTVVFGRVTSPANSIVGAWYGTPEDGGTDQIVFTFLADGTLMVADKGTHANDPNGDSGIEWGTYTFNSGTGLFTPNVIVNTDGQWGMSHGDGPAVLELVGDTLSLGGGLVFNRVSAVVADPAPGTRQVGAGTADTLTGTIYADTLTGLGGNDTLQGGDGIDAALYGDARDQYQLDAITDGMSVTGLTGAEGTDTVTFVERLKFADVNLALDVAGNGHAGIAAKILGSVIGASYVDVQEYMGILLSYLDAGVSYETLILGVLDVRLGALATDHDSVVDLFYMNLAGGPPAQKTHDELVAYLDNEIVTVGQFAVLASDHDANLANINLQLRASTGIEYI